MRVEDDDGRAREGLTREILRRRIARSWDRWMKN
jgi:hypothetical protein